MNSGIFDGTFNNSVSRRRVVELEGDPMTLSEYFNMEGLAKDTQLQEERQERRKRRRKTRYKEQSSSWSV